MRTIVSAAQKMTFGILISLLAVAACGAERNGNWWVGQSKESKAQYIIGVFDGINLQHARTTEGLIGLPSWIGPKEPCDAACVKSRMELWSNLQAGTRDFSSLTAGQLVDGCDSFLADYRNRSILLVDLLEVVVWSIKGASADEVERRLVVLRKEVVKRE